MYEAFVMACVQIIRRNSARYAQPSEKYVTLCLVVIGISSSAWVGSVPKDAETRRCLVFLPLQGSLVRRKRRESVRS